MLTRCLAFVRGMLRRRAIDEEIDEELQFHLEQEVRAHVDRGVSPAEAHRLAVLGLGGVAQTREAVRDIRTTWVEAAWREGRQGIRALWSMPAFTVPALIVLALGMGGTTAVFSVLDGVLLRPLPYPDADELVRVWSRNDERRIPFLSVSPADFEDWRSRAPFSLQLGAYDRPRVLPLRDGAEPVTVMSVTESLFSVLGVAPALGRGFRDEDAPGFAAVISHEFWQRRFAGAPNALGHQMVVGDDAWTIVGVMPPRFDVPNTPADLWVPLVTDGTDERRFAHTLRVVARAAPPADAATVTRDLDAVAAQLALDRPASNRGWSVNVLPLFDVVVSPEFRRSLWIVAGAVLFVLMMASMSVAGLLLTRAASRQRELAVRVALGASRGSLVRLLLLECLVLSLASGVLGLLLAYWGVALLPSIGSATIPRLDEVAVSGRVFAFAAATTLLSALTAGVLPAWRSTGSLHEMLRSRGAVSERGSARTLHLLVVVEVASAVLLVVGAALLVQTVLNLQRRDLGFDAGSLLALHVTRPSSAEDDDLVGRTERALSRVGAVPGVRNVAAASALPFSGQNSGNTFEIEGRHDGQPLPDADYRVVSPGYFQTLGIPIHEGRGFVDADGLTRGAAIISETAARRFWPEGDAIDRRLKLGRSDWLTIVGIVGDARYLALDDPSDSVRPMLYVPHRQMPSTPMTIVLRSSVEPESLAAEVRRILVSDGTFGVTRIDSMAAMLREASVSQRFTMNLVTAFAATAVTLAVVGLYGLLAFLVARRTKEIGVRFALGASPWDVIRMVVGRTVTLAGIGVAAGLAASLGMTGALRNVTFGVSAHDPPTYAAVALGFVVLAVAVGMVPALRAARIDPVRVIRSE